MLHPNAGFVTILLIALYSWHFIAMKLERQGHIHIPMGLHYYSWLYGILGLLTLHLFIEISYKLAMVGYLDPQLVALEFKGEEPDWQAEVGLEHNGFLRWMSLLSPISVAATFVVCVWHTAEILMTVGSHGKKLSECELCYETNFMVADLYEAVALWKFALIAMAVINARIDAQQEITSKEVDIVVKADSEISEAERKLLSTLQKLMGTLNQLQDAVGELTMQGTMMFVGACLTQSLFHMSLISLVFLRIMTEEKSITCIEQAKFLFTGMGVIASTAAI
eukprot:TRINITY_DN32709_c0_g1_i3.p1 TRINITY_DN32709_c0_g1~~TRINITY_DN32709_c0_g1_i3.p1  ORF type:complete len:279 (+),score=21.69 TRINITY_DN32709_c0_g1_i3:82-918(+)